MIAKIQFYREEYFAYREVYYAKMQAIQNDHEIYTHIFYNKTPSFNAFTSTFRDEVENTTKSLEFREPRSHVNEEFGGPLLRAISVSDSVLGNVYLIEGLVCRIRGRLSPTDEHDKNEKVNPKKR